LKNCNIIYTIYIIPDNGCKGIGPLPYLHGWSLEISLTVPLNIKQVFEISKQSIRDKIKYCLQGLRAFAILSFLLNIYSERSPIFGTEEYFTTSKNLQKRNIYLCCYIKVNDENV